MGFDQMLTHDESLQSASPDAGSILNFYNEPRIFNQTTSKLIFIDYSLFLNHLVISLLKDGRF